ncbi:MAG: DUF58 domain-containing protein [Parvularculaceae bacterium]
MQAGEDRTQQIRHEAEQLASGYPPLLVEALRIAHSVAAGLHGRRRAGPGETFWQHRAYAFGDPVSMIDWRQSARIPNRLYVRQNEWEAAASVWIWRDGSRSLDYSSSNKLPTKRYRADILAVALASLLSDAGERIGLASPTPRQFHGRNASVRFFEELCTGKTDDTASTPPPIPAAAHSRIIYLSDFFADTDKISDAAARCAALGATGVMLQVVDPAEEAFPFAGRTEFKDPESLGKMLFGSANSIRDSYLREFSAQRSKLKAACDSLNWRFLIHRTDQPAASALLSLYHAIAGEGSRSW